MKDSDLVIMTKAEAKPEKQKSVIQALRNIAVAARDHPGCIEYSILCAEDSAVTINFERWASNEERGKFMASADVKKFASAVSDAFTETPKPILYDILDVE